ncbi:hypothetical protein DXG01_006614 [Tephrocybe rancida]|nr:hypothetical protein DXG01_006614 [Tephrocybe rancida]
MGLSENTPPVLPVIDDNFLLADAIDFNWSLSTHLCLTSLRIVCQLLAVSGPATRQSTVDAAHSDKVRQKAGRFRILIIWRANSGKTTTLKKVCKSTEEPAIHSGDGVSVYHGNNLY